ncbi:cupredoxin domain-containing protein [Dictyobacter arantiisoli]|nr:hypothetical protein [Dictyobacter arantiisoli]
MGETNFDQSSITMKKGDSIILVNDNGQIIHTIQNGIWSNGEPRPKLEPGAPSVDLSVTDGTQHLIGPFNTDGTFHLYCTVHPGMNLTVIVK